jgi:hypothetical protein
MRGFGGFSVRGEFAVMGVWRRDLRFSYGCKALAEKCQRVLVIPAD